jgi:hypothetical protein
VLHDKLTFDMVKNKPKLRVFQASQSNCEILPTNPFHALSRPFVESHFDHPHQRGS